MSQDNQTRTPEAPQASRRALLFGIAAVGAVASPAVASALLKAPKAPVTETSLSAPPATAPSPDAKLLQLFDEYMATEYWRLSELVERGKAEHYAKYPMPEAMLVQPGDAELGLPEAFEDRRWPPSYIWRTEHIRKSEWPVDVTLDPPEGLHFTR
jgi:hypothetical protein